FIMHAPNCDLLLRTLQSFQKSSRLKPNKKNKYLSTVFLLLFAHGTLLFTHPKIEENDKNTLKT
ncbi:MAG: hypothetical protein P8P16_01305, partial [Amylibacter sp.]|nr:hypothetical protein [Amylibacter sp.]